MVLREGSCQDGLVCRTCPIFHLVLQVDEVNFNFLRSLQRGQLMLFFCQIDCLLLILPGVFLFFFFVFLYCSFVCRIIRPGHPNPVLSIFCSDKTFLVFVIRLCKLVPGAGLERQVFFLIKADNYSSPSTTVFASVG